MKDFDELVGVVNRLLAPDGCPWDREQTLQSIRPYLIEEVYEIVEAIDLNHDAHISEELGDVFFHLIFLCKIAEKEHRFTLQETLHWITEKLIRRHPHVFGSVKVESVEQVEKQWDEIKQHETGKPVRKSVLDDIPKDLPALARAQKMLSKFKKVGFEWESIQMNDEDQLGKELLDLIQEGSKKGVNVLHALLKQLTLLDQQFRAWEKEQR